jgi:hypothetical protein
MSADLYLMSLSQQDDAEGCNSASKRAKATHKLVTELHNALKDAQDRIVRLTAGDVSDTRLDALLALQAQLVSTAAALDAVAVLSEPTWG